MVDDEPEVARLTASILEQAGHRASWECTALAALARLDSRGHFDLVVADIIMPGEMNGIELGRTIRRRWPQVPVVLATAAAERAEAFQKEFPLLRKPFSTIELVRMAETVVRRARASQSPPTDGLLPRT